MGTMIELQSDDHPLEVYEAKPQGSIKGGIIVIHEIWALNDHTKSIADRYAAEGYWAIAPNLLAETNIAAHATEKLQHDYFNPETRSEVQPIMRELMTPMSEQDFGEKTLARVKACFNYLYDQPENHEWVAVTGYCFGGSYSYALAIAEPRLKAAIPYYGHLNLDDTEALKNITCPISAFYGEQDERLMKSLPQVESVMKEADVHFIDKVYPQCGHAFFNDTNPYAYNEAAARDSWQQSLDFLSTV